MYGRNFRVLNITQNTDLYRVLKTSVSKITSNSISLISSDQFGHARKQLRTEGINLIMLDLNLPGALGLDYFHQLRLEFPKIPVIVIADVPDSPLALKAVSEGACDYLTSEDFQPGVLSRMIRYAVVRHHLVSSINDLSLYDELTGVNNKRSFELLFNQQVRNAARHERSMMLFNVTIENLTVIGKDYGPPESDRAVLDTLDLIRQTFRNSDIIGRLEFDQFTVLLPETDSGSGETVTERLQTGLEELHRNNHRLYRLSLRFGYTQCGPNRYDSLGKILEKVKETASTPLTHLVG